MTPTDPATIAAVDQARVHARSLLDRYVAAVRDGADCCDEPSRPGPAAALALIAEECGVATAVLTVALERLAAAREVSW